MDVRRSEPNVGEHSLIVGRYPFSSYQRFVRTKQVGGNLMDERTLAQDWREIQQHAADADGAEAGIAENPGLLPLPDEMIAIAQETRQQEAIEKTFGIRACQWWLVEIDRAIVFQASVDLRFVQDFKASLPRPLSHEDHIRISAGNFITKPHVTASQIAEDRYVFLSPSTDVRFLGANLIDPASIKGQQPRGYATHVVAVYFGSGTNCLSAVHVNNRLILVNGTHRAYSLRDLGFTHVACLVTHVTNDEEKALLLPPQVKHDEARYLIAKRPPLFKDYFNPMLRKVLPTVTTNTLLRLRLKHSKEPVPST